ncbi:hypothetical protein V6N13_073413 [Hibiscus sabdariffa]
MRKWGDCNKYKKGDEGFWLPLQELSKEVVGWKFEERVKMHVEVAQHASENEAANVLITNVADKVACIVEESEKVVVSAIFNELYAANTLDTEEVKVAVPTSVG